jgi:GINS complex subunit 2
MPAVRACNAQGRFGPFRPLIQSEVPLWLALTLKKRQRCRLIPPAWLDIEKLGAWLEGEKRHPHFEKLPLHFFEISHLILEAARDDVQDAHGIEGLLEDLENKRHAKLRIWLAQNRNEGLEGLTPLELNRVRRFANGAKDVLRAINPARNEQPSQQPAAGEALEPQQPIINDAAYQRALQRRR